MSNYNDIKKHIQSVSTTKQITNAMYLLSTSRLKKGLLTVPALSEYLGEIRVAMANILRCAEHHGFSHKFMEKDTVGRALYFTVMGDKGLCGDYNSRIAAELLQIKENDPDGEIIVPNPFSAEYLKRKGIEADYVLDFSTIHISDETIKKLTRDIIDMYMTDYFNEIYVISTQYSNKDRTPACIRLLPLQSGDFDDVPINCHVSDVIFEPSFPRLFSAITPEYINGVLYDLILQANTSENASRMEAMRSATDNAAEMTDELSAKLNNERQVAITQEITEITASQM